MASCVLCASLDVNRSVTRFTTRDKARSHAAQHLLQTKHLEDDDCSSLDQVFEHCFPNFGLTPARKQNKIVVKKEEHQSLSNVCRTILNGRISEASPRVTCQKCGSRIILYCGKSKGCQFSIAINHASTHLGIGLFECRECERPLGSKDALRKHLMASHGLKYLPKYFTDKSNDFIEEITASIEQCFAEGNNNGPPDEKARMIRLTSEVRVRSMTKGSKLAIERQLFCLRLIRQEAGEDEKVQCRVCSKRIGIKRIGGYKAQYALEHALVHLKKPVFRCKICSDVRHNRRSVSDHLKSVHALPLLNNYDSLADAFHADVLDTLRKCYADKDDNGFVKCVTKMTAKQPAASRKASRNVIQPKKVSKPKKEGRHSLFDVCHTVFKGRISEASPRTTCQKCGSKIVIYRRARRFEIAINHASSHLGIDLFECRKCGRSFGSRSAVCNHLISSHGLRCLSEYFTDKSSDFIEQITNSIQQCFTEGKNNGPSDEKARMIRLRNEACVRSMTTGSKLSIERHLFCYRLIRQLASDDGKIQCRVCPKRISIKQKDGHHVHNAMNHALVHLKKPVYRCKVCSNLCHTRDAMCSHLKSAHALSLLNNYESLTDEFHEDVLDMLGNCYSDKEDK